MSGPPQQHQFRRAIISGSWYGLSHDPHGNYITLSPLARALGANVVGSRPPVPAAVASSG